MMGTWWSQFIANLYAVRPPSHELHLNTYSIPPHNRNHLHHSLPFIKISCFTSLVNHSAIFPGGFGPTPATVNSRHLLESSRLAGLLSSAPSVTYLLAPFGSGVPAAWPAPVVIIQRASATARARSGQERAREWGNSYRHAELSEQSTKQARRARWRQAHFTGFSSAPALH